MPFDSENFPARKDAVVFAPAITPAPILPAEPLSRQEADPVLHALLESRRIIENPNRWCVGLRTRHDERHGYQHCAMGALDEVSGGDQQSSDNTAAVRYLARFATPPAPYVYACAAVRIAQHNNHLGHAATLAMWDRAIAARTAEGSPKNVTR